MKSRETNSLTSRLTSSWRESEFLVVDLEGTGSHKDQRIIEVAAVTVRGGRVQDEIFQRLVNPGIAISLIASRIHGIFDSDVQSMPPISSIRQEFEDLASGKILVAHNAVVERNLLAKNLPTVTFPYIIDTLRISRTLYPNRTKHGLDDLIERFELNRFLLSEKISRRHRAVFDALATSHAFIMMVADKLPRDVTTYEILRVGAIDASMPDSSRTDGANLFQPDLF